MAEPIDSSGGLTSGMASGSGSGCGKNKHLVDQRERQCVAEEGDGESFGREILEMEMNSGHDGIEGKEQTLSADRNHESEQVEQGRDHTQQEVMQMVQEIKRRLPSEKRSCSQPNTVAAMNYALNCVKQVQANSEYYTLLMCNGLEERKDTEACSLDQLEVILSENMLKNTDTFVVVFLLTTGRVVYASEQASNILNCKRKFLLSTKFVELLFHQDVSIFYSHAAQPHLPPWNIRTDSSAGHFKYAQDKSFFSRLRGGKDGDGEMRYNPFRITPYLLKVNGLSGEEEQPCCLALAERIISGYEAPRIPTDKRIFTTTHSPGCVFLDVDDRAVPLLGYLPQDLIGTSILTYLHPEDLTLMLALHRKIVKYVGQPPFGHSPIRFRSQNGDYVTLDTSWSSFVNPWSRKVAFIIGRHKVHTGPLNEDVFAAQSKTEFPVAFEDVKELQGMIYKLFQQPVHTNGSSGYGSLGSNGSHEQYISMASSSDSNGNLWEDVHREAQICNNVKNVKSGGQQEFLDSPRKGTMVGKACNEIPASIPHNGQRSEVHCPQNPIEVSHRKQAHVPSYQQINCVDSIIRYLESCSGSAMKRKSKSISIATSSSFTSSEEKQIPAAPPEDKNNADEAVMNASSGQESQVSAESTVIVTHTTTSMSGAPGTDMSLPTKAMSVVSATSQCSYSSTIVHVPQPESEVTTIEDALIGSQLADTAPTVLKPALSSSTLALEEFKVVGLTKKVLSAHTQKEEQEYVDHFRHRILESPYCSYLQQDNSSMALSNHRGDDIIKSTGDWNRSHSSKHRNKHAKLQALSNSDCSKLGHFLPIKNSSSESSLPNPTIFTQIPMPFQPPYYPSPPYPCGIPPGGAPVLVQSEQMYPVMQVMTPFISPVMAFIMPYQSNYTICPQSVADVQGVPGATPSGLIPPPITKPLFVSLMDNPPARSEDSFIPSASEAFIPSPISSPWPKENVDGAQPTVLFSISRSSSPLQLNLLQEELPKPNTAQSITERLHEYRAKKEALSESDNQEAQFNSCVLLDLLLHEDARSGTGSNASFSGSGESGESLGSESGLCSNGTSASRAASSDSSKYFASNDSSDSSGKKKKSLDALEHSSFDNRVEDSLWTMIQHMPEPVMMTYQIHLRDQEEVLKKDREKLLLLQPMQPWFTQEQKEELAEVHSWIQYCILPQEINTNGCVNCNLTTVEENHTAAHILTLSAPDSSIAQDCPPEELTLTLDT